MMRRKGILALFCLALLSAMPLQAQVGAGFSSDDAKRERVQELILMRLNTALGLNSAQSQKLGDILRKYHQQKAAFRGQMRDLLAQLQAAYNSGNESEISRIIPQLTAIRSQLSRIDDQVFADLKPMFNPKQQAQYFLVLDQIRHEIQSIRRGEGSGNPAASSSVTSSPP